MSSNKDSTNNKLRVDGCTYSSVEAEVMAVALCLTQTALRPKVERDDARQAGMKEPRGSKMPKLDEWLDGQDLKLSNDKLWTLLPDDSEADVYRDGEKVCENSSQISSRGERTITHHSKRGGFDKRVTEARNRQKRR